MRNSIQNNDDGDRTEIFVACGDSFTDKHGDRSGVAIWGYDENKKMFYVKRKSGRDKYIKYRSQFTSFTAVGLQEMLRATFYNPSNNIEAWDFKKFLEDQAKKGFSGFPTAKSRIRIVPGLLDESGNTYKHVMWPPTKKEKVILIARPPPDGSLRNMKLWVYDDDSTTAVIRLS